MLPLTPRLRIAIANSQAQPETNNALRCRPWTACRYSVPREWIDWIKPSYDYWTFTRKNFAAPVGANV